MSLYGRFLVYNDRIMKYLPHNNIIAVVWWFLDCPEYPARVAPMAQVPQPLQILSRGKIRAMSLCEPTLVRLHGLNLAFVFPGHLIYNITALDVLVMLYTFSVMML